MSKRKKNEEERKQRREEMAAKFPMQKPRTNVTSVLTKKAPASALQGLGGLEAKRAETGLKTAGTVSDWLDGMDLGEKRKVAWERHGEAQQGYGEALKQQSDQTANVAKRLREKHQTNAGTLAGAQAQQALTQVKGLKEAVNSEIAQCVMNSFTEGMRRRSSNAETIAEQWKDNPYLTGKYTGVTGSDQTGASIYGMREDTSYKSPNDEWTDGERRLYEYHLKNNPQEAEDYAIRVNNRHNKKVHDEELQEIAEGTVRNGILTGIGARAANMVSFLEGYNEYLERVAIGRNNISRNVVPSEIKETVDDTNEENITEQYGDAAGKIYKYGMPIVDVALGKSLLRKDLTTVKNLRTAVNVVDLVNEIYQDSGASSVWEFANDTSDEIKSIEVGSREWFADKRDEIEKQTSVYMEEGLSERTARWKATKQFIEQSLK